MTEEKTEYNAFARDFAQTRENRPWPEFQFFMPDLVKGDRVMDLGCGGGRLRSFVDPEVVLPGAYFGLDISSEMIKVCRENFSQDHWFTGNMTKLPFGADQFDWVIGMASFHHLLSRKEQIQALRELHRVTRPGGRVFLTTWILPRKHFWPNILRGNFKNWNIPFGKEKHPRTYRWVSHKELSKLMKKAGFEIEHAERFQERNFVVRARKKK